MAISLKKTSFVPLFIVLPLGMSLYYRHWGEIKSLSGVRARLLVLCYLLLVSICTKGQEALSTDNYPFSHFFLNPAMTGYEPNLFKTRLIANRYLLGLDNSPTTLSFMGSFRDNLPNGYGLLAVADRNGNTQKLMFGLSMARHMRLSHGPDWDNSLSIGASLFLLNPSITIESGPDQGAYSEYFFGGSIGAFLRIKSFFVGACFYSFFNVESNPEIYSLNNLNERYIITGNFGVQLGRDRGPHSNIFTPNVVVRHRNITTTTDLHLRFDRRMSNTVKGHKFFLWGSLLSRWTIASEVNDANALPVVVFLFAGIKRGPFSIGYSPGYGTSNFLWGTLGIHSVMIGWDFNIKDRPTCAWYL